MGCDVFKLFGRLSLEISIHAPAWGATSRVRVRRFFVSISIHAPAWGATLLFLLFNQFFVYFNPRTRMGCDLMFVSYLIDFYINFNPRTRMGCDAPSARRKERVRKFQSTHPHGVRRDRSQAPRPIYGYFNPRTRMGCDYVGRDRRLIRLPISIHAPAWGATYLLFRRCWISTVFQSTHPHGVRRAIL